MRTTFAYAITTEDIQAERERVAGDDSKLDFANILRIRERELPPLGPRDVELRILAVSAEHNVSHAATGDIVDIVKAHGGLIFPGNSAVAEVAAIGRDVRRFKPGDIVQTHCNAQPDAHGYPLRIWAFDALGSVGFYGEHAVVADWQILPLPLDGSASLWQLAALPLRGPTAYHLWRRAIGMYRVKVPREQRARLNVLSFGGGVGELFLMLAKSEGHAAYFCSGTSSRRAALASMDIVPIDRDLFRGFASAADVQAFREHCAALTRDEGMHIVCDMLRGPLFEAGLAVAARQGVNVSAGWQLSQQVSYRSPLLSVKQLTLDHCHYETIPGCSAAASLAGSVFRPKVHDEIYAFEDLPRCFQEMQRNEQNGIPIIRVARDLPATVAHIAALPTD